ncbi:catalase family peroxidase [Fibrella aquatilis]|uniref:Catalase-related peroxidase n=1 Tax=Fibrella aquatilis TaxID=2817059 RepID=A0A939G5Z1_9BACT|nr:catalase family peroxidase [Fibrella aquatilis]MBO0931828.1 catalase family peroxidase [Fibrella aquatilis]
MQSFLSYSISSRPLLPTDQKESSRSLCFLVAFAIGLFSVAFPLSIKAQDGNAGIQSKTRVTPIQAVDMLHSAFGKHDGRAVHAKGIILEGSFTPARGAANLTKAAHVQKQTLPVVVRFSDFTGILDIPDTTGASHPRGMAIKFLMPDNQSADIVAHSFNGFPVATTDEFKVLLEAIGAATRGGNPAPLNQFLATHPIAKTFLTTQKPLTTSWATLSYFGVNSFKFTNKAGQSQFVRYQFIPEAGEQFLTKEQIAGAGPNYLQEEIRQHVAKQPIVFKLYAQLAQPGDQIGNPSIAWPDSRKRVLLGTIRITNMAANTMAQDKTLFFNPNNVPDGITIADPMLLDRARAYPISVGQRQGSFESN